MWIEKSIPMFLKEEYDKYITGLSYATTIADGKYTYNATTRTVGMRKATNVPASGIRVPLAGLYKGDVVEIEADYRYISGTKAWFLLLENGVINDKLQPSSNGEWEHIKISFTLNDDISTTTYAELGAYGYGDGGECEVRNVIANIKSRSSLKDIFDMGSNANGNWIKYSDGTMECWGSKTFSNLAVTTATGSAFYANSVSTPMGNFPQTFIEAPKFMVTCNCPSDYALVTATTLPTTTNLPQINTFRFTSGTVTSITYNWNAKGKWK